jgi:hypothetical protein
MSFGQEPLDVFFSENQEPIYVAELNATSVTFINDYGVKFTRWNDDDLGGMLGAVVVIDKNRFFLSAADACILPYARIKVHLDANTDCPKDGWRFFCEEFNVSENEVVDFCPDLMGNRWQIFLDMGNDKKVAIANFASKVDAQMMLHYAEKLHHSKCGIREVNENGISVIS